MQKLASLFFLVLVCFSVSTLAAEKGPKVIVALGDSLTEGYGVAKEQAFPALLENKLNKDGGKFKIINAGISGSTTASALGRLKWQLKSKPDILLLALGANDGLRGIPVAESEKNLSIAIELAQKEGLKVILCGMLLPPNYGEQYRKEFQMVFERIAAKYKVIFVPFMLEKVAGQSSLNLADGIHPNEKGHALVAETLFKSLKGKL